MADLTGKQVRYLRGIGQRLDPLVVVGKAGLSEGVIVACKTAIALHELIKVRLPAVSPAERDEMADAIAAATGAACVGAVGRCALFYKQGKEPADKAGIVLP